MLFYYTTTFNNLTSLLVIRTPNFFSHIKVGHAQGSLDTPLTPVTLSKATVTVHQ